MSPDASKWDDYVNEPSVGIQMCPLHLLCIVIFIFMEIKIILFLGIRETFEQGAGQEMEPLRGPGPMVIIPVENLLDLGDPEMEDDASSIGKLASPDPLDDWWSVYNSDSDSDWVNYDHFRNLRHRLTATPPLRRQHIEEMEEDDVKIVYKEIPSTNSLISVYLNVSFCKLSFVNISMN